MSEPPRRPGKQVGKKPPRVYRSGQPVRKGDIVLKDGSYYIVAKANGGKDCTGLGLFGPNATQNNQGLHYFDCGDVTFVSHSAWGDQIDQQKATAALAAYQRGPAGASASHSVFQLPSQQQQQQQQQQMFQPASVFSQPAGAAPSAWPQQQVQPTQPTQPAQPTQLVRTQSAWPQPLQQQAQPAQPTQLVRTQSAWPQPPQQQAQPAQPAHAKPAQPTQLVQVQPAQQQQVQPTQLVQVQPAQQQQAQPAQPTQLVQAQPARAPPMQPAQPMQQPAQPTQVVRTQSAWLQPLQQVQPAQPVQAKPAQSQPARPTQLVQTKPAQPAQPVQAKPTQSQSQPVPAAQLQPAQLVQQSRSTSVPAVLSPQPNAGPQPQQKPPQSHKSPSSTWSPSGETVSQPAVTTTTSSDAKPLAADNAVPHQQLDRTSELSEPQRPTCQAVGHERDANTIVIQLPTELSRSSKIRLATLLGELYQQPELDFLTDAIAQLLLVPTPSKPEGELKHSAVS